MAAMAVVASVYMPVVEIYAEIAAQAGDTSCRPPQSRLLRLPRAAQARPSVRVVTAIDKLLSPAQVVSIDLTRNPFGSCEPNYRDASRFSHSCF